MSTLRFLPRRLHLTPSLNLQQRLSSSLRPTPSPPRLPAAQQAEFERLQRIASAPLATPSPTETHPLQQSRHVTEPVAAETNTPEQGGMLYKGAPPEFEGDVNPKTGEVGGPKNEPLRWGAQSDWSFNGKVTDF